MTAAEIVMLEQNWILELETVLAGSTQILEDWNPVGSVMKTFFTKSDVMPLARIFI
jgi:hypothetical protein